MDELVLVLHNVRSAHNVGSILRTAECAGVSRVFLCGTTPSPTDRFGRPRLDIAKVALGAERTMVWEYESDTTAVLADLASNGMCIVALEQDESSVPYTKYLRAGPTALVVGDEVRGISADILTVCDAVIEIPLRGAKESLNVAVAAGIALFSLLKERT